VLGLRGFLNVEDPMLSSDGIRIVIAASLLLHGIAHAVALVAAVSQSLSGPSPSRVSLKSGLFRSLEPKSAGSVAIPFWALSTLAFLLACVSFWGLLGWGRAWRQVAVAGSVVSILGTILFSGIWPGSPNPRRSLLNTAVSLSMNAAILISQLWLKWPPQAMFGN
jgi:hypothetical protein